MSQELLLMRHSESTSPPPPPDACASLSSSVSTVTSQQESEEEYKILVEKEQEQQDNNNTDTKNVKNTSNNNDNDNDSYRMYSCTGYENSMEQQRMSENGPSMSTSETEKNEVSMEPMCECEAMTNDNVFVNNHTTFSMEHDNCYKLESVKCNDNFSSDINSNNKNAEKVDSVNEPCSVRESSSVIHNRSVLTRLPLISPAFNNTSDEVDLLVTDISRNIDNTNNNKIDDDDDECSKMRCEENKQPESVRVLCPPTPSPPRPSHNHAAHTLRLLSPPLYEQVSRESSPLPIAMQSQQQPQEQEQEHLPSLCSCISSTQQKKSKSCLCSRSPSLLSSRSHKITGESHYAPRRSESHEDTERRKRVHVKRRRRKKPEETHHITENRLLEPKSKQKQKEQEQEEEEQEEEKRSYHKCSGLHTVHACRSLSPLPRSTSLHEGNRRTASANSVQHSSQRVHGSYKHSDITAGKKPYCDVEHKVRTELKITKLDMEKLKEELATLHEEYVVMKDKLEMSEMESRNLREQVHRLQTMHADSEIEKFNTPGEELKDNPQMEVSNTSIRVGNRQETCQDSNTNSKPTDNDKEDPVIMYDSLVAELVKVKALVVQQQAILDRLDIHYPYASELTDAAYTSKYLSLRPMHLTSKKDMQNDDDNDNNNNEEKNK